MINKIEMAADKVKIAAIINYSGVLNSGLS